MIASKRDDGLDLDIRRVLIVWVHIPGAGTNLESCAGCPGMYILGVPTLLSIRLANWAALKDCQIAGFSRKCSSDFSLENII